MGAASSESSMPAQAPEALITQPAPSRSWPDRTPVTLAPSRVRDVTGQPGRMRTPLSRAALAMVAV